LVVENLKDEEDHFRNHLKRESRKKKLEEGLEVESEANEIDYVKKNIK